MDRFGASHHRKGSLHVSILSVVHHLPRVFFPVLILALLFGFSFSSTAAHAATRTVAASVLVLEHSSCTQNTAMRQTVCMVIQVSAKVSAQVPAAKGPIPNIIYIYGDIPTATEHGRAADTNDATFSGSYKNNGNATFSAGGLTLNAEANCAGIGAGGSGSETLPTPWKPGTGSLWSFTAQGRCVVCTDGEITGFPPFTITGDVSLYGESGGYQWVNSQAASVTVGLSNSDLYPLPC